MRSIFLALMIAVLCASAQAADAPPEFKDRPLYFQARGRLIKLGYRPVPFRHQRALSCVYDSKICTWAPEVAYCTGPGVAECNFIFRRRRDGAFFVVLTEKAEHRFVAFDPLNSAEIGDLAIHHPILRPDRIAIEAMVMRIPPWHEPPTPLCSEPHGIGPCWVKPPAGYRPSRKPSR